jgi:uncharacterized Fe-S cluster-containing protein
MEKYHSSPVKSYIAVSDYAGNSDFDIVQPDASRMKQIFTPVANYAHLPTEQEIRAIMEQMGKTRPDDELNCGSCGYNTCRDKAIAIYQGKAEISMCLPFLKDRAESFSDTIVTNSPNAVIVLNDRLEVQQLNNAAQKLLNLRSPSDILGDHVVRILDPKIFSDVLETGKNVRNERIYLAEYKKFVEQTVIALESTRTLICIMSDITEEEDERRRKEEISRQTAEVADKVIEKQMRIVQNIASLLGETAAETKIALTKLKESVTDE